MKSTYQFLMEDVYGMQAIVYHRTGKKFSYQLKKL